MWSTSHGTNPGSFTLTKSKTWKPAEEWEKEVMEKGGASSPELRLQSRNTPSLSPGASLEILLLGQEAQTHVFQPNSNISHSKHYQGKLGYRRGEVVGDWINWLHANTLLAVLSSFSPWLGLFGFFFFHG